MKILLSLSSFLFAAVAYSATPQVLNFYFEIQEKLARDTMDGVPAAAQKIADLEKSSAVGKAATKMVKDKKLEDARKDFKELSSSIIANTDKKALDKAKVAYCPMADAKWIQRSADIQNPYYGKAMLDCGQFE